METGMTIYGQTLRKVGIKLPTDVMCLLRCGQTTIYRVLEIFTGAVNSVVEKTDENADALEKFTQSLADWSNGWDNRFNEALEHTILNMIETASDGTPLLVVGSKRYSLTEYAEGVQISYSNLVISPDKVYTIGSDGGEVKITFSATCTKTIKYSDSNVKNETLALEIGKFAFSLPSSSFASINPATRAVTFAENGSTNNRSVVVTASVDVYGTALTKEITIQQKGKEAVVPFYAGCVGGSSADFSALSADVLKSGATKYNIMAGTKQSDGSYMHSVDTTNVIFYVLVPTSYSLTKAVLVTTAGLNSSFSESDINDSSVWKAAHENVVIDNVTYAVRGYRNVSLAGNSMEIYIK